jgi:DNA-binding CsgD family transcriptional regulator
MSSGIPAGGLRGRSHECELLDRLLVGVRGRASGVVVVQGDAGVGKTALLDYLVKSASGFQVVRTTGIESEMELPFAAAQQLCVPLMDRLGDLPDPQRQALGVAFGLGAGTAPDRFMVGLAALNLLCAAAEDQPLLCVVDDVQWLDRASAQTLAFVARRLLADPVGMVFATRERNGELVGLPELIVPGLRETDARALLASVFGAPMDRQIRDRIVAETHGNPLALLEWTRGLTPAELAGGLIQSNLPLPGRIEESFARQLAQLPPTTQQFLLVVAAEPVGDPVLVWRAAGRLGIGTDAATPAIGAGLIELGNRVIFRHPLVRSAAYRSATATERQDVHRALADTTDPEVDPDRRAWHLAQATSAPNEEVALELERSSGRAQARGGLAAAAALLERSATLTLDRGRRAERTLAAAQVNVQAGAFDTSLRLLNIAETGALDEFQSARAELMRGQIAFAARLNDTSASMLLKAAERLEPLDVNLARETYLDAYGAVIFAGSLATGTTLRDVSRAARAAPPQVGPPRLCDLLLDAFALKGTQGLAAAAPALRSILDGLDAGRFPREEELRWSWHVSMVYYLLWDIERWGFRGTRRMHVVREAGALALLPFHLSSLGIYHIWAGEFQEALLRIAELQAIGDATGAHLFEGAPLLLAGLRSNDPTTSRLIETYSNETQAGGMGLTVKWIGAIHYNGLGRYPEALEFARQACEVAPELWISDWALPELVEAATRSGHAHITADALARLGEIAAVLGTDWVVGIEARSRALVSEGEVAEGHYRMAIEHLSRTRLRPDLARAHLLYGEWLRRENRRVDAREHLRLAHEMLVTMGIEGFAARAQRELLATGETVRKRSVATRNELTTQEANVARLAVDGHTNAEIGAQLFLSASTVDYHLRKVFTKLGIRSRRQLEAALAKLETMDVSAGTS